VAIDKYDTKTLHYQELSLPMTPLRTALRNETSDNIEYGEAILVALKLKAERQLEVIAPCPGSAWNGEVTFHCKQVFRPVGAGIFKA
jgi:hypothetical protein